MKKVVKIFSAILVLALVLGIGCGVYVSDYYRADEAAAAAMVSGGTVTVETGDGMTVFSPSLPSAGLIFYPGGKVEYTAYAPLMRALAEEGVLCVLVQMPGNLAVLDVNAADGIPERYPDIEQWYIGGHSLGGSMAASYASKHSEEYIGLILLAAYSTADLTASGPDALLIRGSRDGVLNMEKYGKYISNLSPDSLERVIEGGNHAQFGSYGSQDGDCEATISQEEQTALTAQYILKFIER